MELKERNDIDEKYKFDLSQFCNSPEEFYQRLEKIEEELPKLSHYKGKLGDPKTYFEFLKLKEQISSETVKLNSYCILLNDIDLVNPQYREMKSRLLKSGKIIDVHTNFFYDEIKNLGEEYLVKLCNDPMFKDYKISFEKTIKQFSHILDSKSIEIISLINFDNFRSMHSTLLHSEMPFDKPKDSLGNTYDLNYSNFNRLMKNEDEVLRGNAWKIMAQRKMQIKNTLFDLILNGVKASDFLNKLKKYDSVLESKLLGENIPNEIFFNIIEKVGQNIEIYKKYEKARSKALKSEEYKPWNSELRVSNFNNEITFDDAVKIMRPCYQKFGETYVKAFDDAINNRWIDVYSTKNKRQGAYNLGMYGLEPRILLNWVDSTRNMFTLAHEFGHAVQHIVTNKKQPVQTAGLPHFLVEVPSITSEVVMFKYLYDNSKSTDQKLLYLEDFIFVFYSKVYGACLKAKFELYLRDSVRQDIPLDVESASNAYIKMRNEYLKLDHKKFDELEKYDWLSNSHYFSHYYNYEYTIAMIVATAFAKGIYEGDKKVLDNFYKFMETGYSKYGLDNLKDCGIDLMDDKVYNDAFSFFEEIVDEFSTLCNEKAKNDEMQKQSTNVERE